MRRNRRAPAVAIVAITVAIVAIPVIRYWLPSEIARWYLAAAANAIEFKQPDSAGRLLSAAKGWNSHIDKDPEYWIYNYFQIAEDQPELQLNVFRQACEKLPEFRWRGEIFAQFQAEEGYFDSAVQMLVLAQEGRTSKKAVDLNLLAYFRALASKDLDLALADVNQALAQFPQEAAYRDTRAWVYYQMGRLTEALDDAEFAVSQTETSSEWPGSQREEVKPEAGQNQSHRDGTEEQADSSSSRPEEPSDKKYVTREEIGSFLWSFAVLRYHRGKILEALGRVADAKRDFDWLNDNNIPIDGKFF